MLELLLLPAARGAGGASRVLTVLAGSSLVASTFRALTVVTASSLARRATFRVFTALTSFAGGRDRTRLVLRQSPGCNRRRRCEPAGGRWSWPSPERPVDMNPVEARRNGSEEMRGAGGLSSELARAPPARELEEELEELGALPTATRPFPSEKPCVVCAFARNVVALKRTGGARSGAARRTLLPGSGERSRVTGGEESDWRRRRLSLRKRLRSTKESP